MFSFEITHWNDPNALSQLVFQYHHFSFFSAVCVLRNRLIDATKVLLSKLYRVHSAITNILPFTISGIFVRLCTNCVCVKSITRKWQLCYSGFTPVLFIIHDVIIIIYWWKIELKYPMLSCWNWFKWRNQSINIFVLKGKLRTGKLR